MNAKESVILYGAGETAVKLLPKLEEKYQICCFADRDSNKWGWFYGYEVMAFDMALSRFPDARVYFTLNRIGRSYIGPMNELVDSKTIEAGRIIGFEKATKRVSCAFLESYLIVNDSTIDSCCCGVDTNHVFKISDYINKKDSIEDALKNWLRITADTAKGVSSVGNPCLNCSKLKYQYWADDKKIATVIFTIENVCNFRCAYCDVWKKEGAIRPITASDYKVIVQTVLSSGLLYNDAKFILASGEPSLDKGQLSVMDDMALKYCDGYIFEIFTNASVFSDKIAGALKEGRAYLLVSVDAGTPETFAKMKGVPEKVFDQVRDNLRRYCDMRGRGSRVVLKYIISDVNANENDMRMFVELCKSLRCDEVVLSRDCNEKDNLDREKIELLIKTAANVRQSGIKCNYASKFFTHDEKELLGEKEYYR